MSGMEARKLSLYSPLAPERDLRKKRKAVFRPSHTPYLELLSKAGKKGLTDFEIAGLLNKYQPTACMRRVELMQLGLVERSGLERKSPSGVSVIVWVITKLGRLKLKEKSNVR